MIVRALVVMLVCWVIGFIVGMVAQQTVQAHVDAYKRDHPIEPQPGDESAEQSAGDAAS